MLMDDDLCRVSSEEDIGSVVDGPEPEETLVRVARKVTDAGHMVVEILTAVPAAEEVSDVVYHGVGHGADGTVVAPGDVLQGEEQK